MNKFVGIALLLIALVSCAKKDSEPAPVYTSADGIWVYTTPDGKVRVEFELKTSSSGTLQLVDATMEVDGVSGDAGGALTNVDLPFVEQIRINANDAALIQPYPVIFMDCSVSTNFTYIAVAEATYTYPSTNINGLTGIVINRK